MVTTAELGGQKTATIVSSTKRGNLIHSRQGILPERSFDHLAGTEITSEKLDSERLAVAVWALDRIFPEGELDTELGAAMVFCYFGEMHHLGKSYRFQERHTGFRRMSDGQLSPIYDVSIASNPKIKTMDVYIKPSGKIRVFDIKTTRISITPSSVRLFEFDREGNKWIQVPINEFDSHLLNIVGKKSLTQEDLQEGKDRLDQIRTDYGH